MGIVFPMMFIMMGVGIIIPCTQAAVMQPFPNMAASASGLFFFIQMVFGGVCGLILQSLNNDSARPLIITIFVVSFLLVVTFYTFVWTLRKKEKNSLRQALA